MSMEHRPPGGTTVGLEVKCPGAARSQPASEAQARRRAYASSRKREKPARPPVEEAGKSAKAGVKGGGEGMASDGVGMAVTIAGGEVRKGDGVMEAPHGFSWGGATVEE